MHGLVSSPSPGHFSPPKAGGGSVQVRVRFCSPPPHVTGQSLESFQSDQLPSTRYNISKRFLKEIHGYEALSEFKKKTKETTMFTWARSFVTWPRFFAFPRTLLPPSPRKLVGGWRKFVFASLHHLRKRSTHSNLTNCHQLAMRVSDAHETLLRLL